MAQPNLSYQNAVVYQAVLQLMAEFVKGERATVEAAVGTIAGVDVIGNGLQFTIAGLYCWVLASLSTKEEGIDIGYKSFRKLLFTSSLNQDLRKMGGEVIVHYSEGKVDTGVYRLILVNHLSACQGS